MSLTSKQIRRQKREWQRIQKASREAYAMAKHDLTKFVLPPADSVDVIYISDRPERPYQRLACPDKWHRRPLVSAKDLDPCTMDPRYLTMAMDHVAFKAVQKAVRLPSGHTAVWWDWEMCR